MSRSFRKTPVCGLTSAASEKADKRAANKRLRTEVKANIYDNADLKLRDVSNPWNMAKDGKQRINPNCYKYYARLMRK